MKRIYTDIDTLLDTRLTVLKQLDPVALNEMVTKDNYWLREHTNWEVLTDGRVTNEQFNEAWASRGNDVLIDATMTAITLPMKSIILHHQVNQDEGVSSDALMLVVNQWPYKLGTEVQEALTVALRHYLVEDILIRFVDIPFEELTPTVLLNDYHQAIMFETHRWIKHFSFALAKLRAPGFTLIGPRLFEKDPSELTLDKKKEEMFGFSMMLLYYIHLDFINVEYFSMFRPGILFKKEKSEKDPSP